MNMTRENARATTGSGGARSGSPLSIDVEQIATERIQTFTSEAMRYWRLIGSSGLLFTIIILLLIGMIYYEAFVAWIPHWFPMALAYTVIFTYLTARTPLRTFLHDADLMFLTPVEGQMNRYFSRTFRYNMVLQIIGLTVILVLLYPLFKDTIQTTQITWLYFILPLILKGWNLQSAWHALRHQNERVVLTHTIVRSVFSFIFLLWWFYAAEWWMLFAFAAVVVLFYLFDRKAEQSHAVNWLRLLDIEKQLQSRFYNFCNAFVDVPHLQSKVKRRAWIANVTAWLPFQQTSAFKYLYLKTFFRANDYFGIYIRLTIIGALVIYAIMDIWGQMIVYLLFMFIVGTQIRALWGHHSRQFWISVFPLPKEAHQQSFIWLTSVLLVAQAVIMFIPILLTGYDFILSGGLLLLGIVFALGYSQIYLKKKVG